MNVLDENILESQRLSLLGWRIPVRQIGHELGWKGMCDGEIIPFLLTLRRPTFFTRDLDFWSRQLCHARSSLVILAVGQYEAAHFIRRMLRQPGFNSQSKRMGQVIRVMHRGFVVWQRHAKHEVRHDWRD